MNGHVKMDRSQAQGFNHIQRITDKVGMLKQIVISREEHANWCQMVSPENAHKNQCNTD